MLTKGQLHSAFIATDSSEPLSEGEVHVKEDVNYSLKHDYIKDIIAVLNAYERKDSLFSCQGQGMDGYSALANLLDIARKLRDDVSKVGK